MENTPYDELNFEEVESEEEDKEEDSATYRINTYGADFTLQTLVEKIKDKDITLPPFQRKYVWKKIQASKLIESFLLGLPVPQIFLYRSEKSESLLVVDGQQRLKTIEFFWKGIFWDDTPFRLIGVKTQWEGKTYTELPEPDKKRLKNSVLRATIFEQVEPEDNKSIFEIFERLNTGGILLNAQEIRNCVIRGKINKFLEELNKYPNWRRLLGKDHPDLRMNDIEMILRFFSLFYGWEKYKRPMKDFIRSFMENNKNLDEKKQEELAKLFKETTDIVISEIGERAFFHKRGINISLFDSIYVALATLKNNRAQDLRESYELLKTNPTYQGNISKSTTDIDRVQGRIKLAISTLKR